jgi:polyphosphate kinase
MEPFLRLIYESAMDSQVISIKITIYRLAKTAKLIEYLSLAAELGKEVLVVIELRARFDEQNNIDWSERLERAGCKIVYGLDVYKVHSKICLITRKVKQKLVMLTQVGTGNYNESTVGQYTDFSLMTSHYDIGLDAAKFFTNISIGAAEGSYHHLLVSPFQIKDQLLRLIEEQIQYGSAGYIRFKINAITDKDLIVALVKASQNGVKIEMITRSISCIRPRVRGWTESIHVISLVGRFLEHARVYQFGQGDDAILYISSADLMTRNMERRIEVAIPVYDTQIKRQIQEVLTLQTLDNVKARYLSSKGKHMPVSPGLPTFDVQESFLFGKN